MSLGKVFLIPADIGNRDWQLIVPTKVIAQVSNLKHFVCEREKTARAILKSMHPDFNQATLNIVQIDKHKPQSPLELLQYCLKGEDIGLLSEAGVASIADPGFYVVLEAHNLNIEVVPLVGPSSIFLALSASGLNGQKFEFHGYLPIDKGKKVKELKRIESDSALHKKTQIFMETPFRNLNLYDSILEVLRPSTYLCVASGITTQSQKVKTMRIQDWKAIPKPKINKIPALFLVMAC